MPLIPNRQTRKGMKGNALFTNWGGGGRGTEKGKRECLKAHALGGILLANNVSRRFLVKRGKGTFTWRNLAYKAFLNQGIKWTSSISYCEHITS